MFSGDEEMKISLGFGKFEANFAQTLIKIRLDSAFFFFLLIP